MKNFFKVMAVVLIAVVFVAMAVASGGDSSDGDKKEISGGEKNNEAITIEEQVLFDHDGVVVTAKEYVHDSIWGDGIKVLVENNSDKDTGVGNTALIVNDYMVFDLFSSTVAAGKKSTETIYISSSDLENAGISNIGKIELYMHTFDPDTYMTTYEADAVTIKTSAFEMMDTESKVSGNELYNKDGIKIIGKYVEADTFWGTSVLLYIENNTDNNISVSCDDLSVNGFMVTPLFSSTVYSGKKAVDDITIFESDLEENGIEKVESIELKFHIYDNDTYNTIADSDVVTITVG